MPVAANVMPTSVEDNEPEVLTLPPSLGNARVAIYLLDFNQCREIQPNEEGVKMCVEAWATNDPYYPRPVLEPVCDTEDSQTKEKRTMWDTFEAAYLQTAREIAATNGVEGVVRCAEVLLQQVKERWAEVCRKRLETEKRMAEEEAAMKAEDEAARATLAAGLAKDTKDRSKGKGNDVGWLSGWASPKRAVDPSWCFS
jgi:hypothetical protein